MSDLSRPTLATGTAPDSGATRAASSALRVLYVEDDRITALLFTAALRQEPDVVVRVAETPDEALALAQGWAPGLLVLDAHLPGMSGFDLLERLRALPGLATQPAFMCSADGDAAMRQRAAAAGFQDFWVKPLAAQALVRLMRGYAAERRTAVSGPLAGPDLRTSHA